MDSKPVVYIFYGDDELALNQASEQLYRQLGDPTTAEMNTTRLDESATDDEILNAAATMPFLAERRLVILSNPLRRLKSKSSREHFCEMLDRLPGSAAVVLLIQDQRRFRRGAWVWDVLEGKHWLLSWAKESAGRAFVKAFALPHAGEMPRWIQNKAEEMGGQFTLDAAQDLASLVENDTRVATQEIEKLLTYANFTRQVTTEDVNLLTAYTGQVSIFDMVDAIAQSSKQKAVEMLHGLLEQQDGYSIFPMVVRQFRQLIQVREILDERKGVEQIQRELRVPAFVAKKLNYQASRFTMDQLVTFYKRLLALDKAIKTGKIPSDLGLDVFIAEMG